MKLLVGFFLVFILYLIFRARPILIFNFHDLVEIFIITLVFGWMFFRSKKS